MKLCKLLLKFLLGSVITLGFFVGGFWVSFSKADTVNEYSSPSFLPTWKLLKPEQKSQFIAGYLYALKDSERMLEIAQAYTEKNPQQAVTAIKKLKELYSFYNLKPDVVVRRVDSFFSEPENRSASLSMAVSSATR